MENARTESARAHDDSDLIAAMEDAPSGQSRSGGNIARDIATQAELEMIADPDTHRRVSKSDAIGHGQARPRAR